MGWSGAGGTGKVPVALASCIADPASTGPVTSSMDSLAARRAESVRVEKEAAGERGKWVKDGDGERGRVRSARGRSSGTEERDSWRGRRPSGTVPKDCCLCIGNAEPEFCRWRGMLGEECWRLIANVPRLAERSLDAVLMAPCRACGPGVEPGWWSDVREVVSDTGGDSSRVGKKDPDRVKEEIAKGESGEVLELDNSPLWRS